MPFPYSRTRTSYAYGRTLGVEVPCEPYQVEYFPWLTYLPNADSPTWSEFYNNPALDGASLNLNLGGYANSWIGSGVPNDPVGVYTTLIDAANLFVDGGYYYYDSFFEQTTVDLWSSGGSFDLTDPIVVSRYSIIGGSTNGATNPAPGHHVYNGVASFSSSAPGAAFIQAKNYGQPIIFELWYSLNPSRTNPLVGYGNYSFLGDSIGNDTLPYLNLSTSGGYVKKYQGGVLKVSADMYNLTTSDFIAGVSYVGTAASGVLQIIINGVVVQSLNTNKPVKKVQTNVDYITEGTVADIGTAKSNANYTYIGVTFTDNTTADIVTDSWYLPATQGLIDTYLCKWAWIVDSHTGGALDDPVYCYPPMFYTLPNVVLPCAPTTPLPSYIPPAPTT